jgi:hypothetical protein
MTSEKTACSPGEFLEGARGGADLAGFDVAPQTLDGRLAIHEAVLSGNVDLVRFLVEMGADVNAVSRGGKTAVQMAAGAAGVGARAMLEYIATVETADFAAAGPGTMAAVETVLVEYDAIVGATVLGRQRYADPDGRLLRHVIAHNSPMLVVSAQASLVPCDFNVLDAKGRSVLFVAALCGCWTVVEYMVAHTDADVCFEYMHARDVSETRGRKAVRMSLLDVCVGGASAVCVRTMLGRGARLANGAEALVRLVSSGDSDNLIIDVARTVTPSDELRLAFFGIHVAGGDGGRDRTHHFSEWRGRRLKCLMRIVDLYVSKTRLLDKMCDTDMLGEAADEVIHDQLLRGKYLCVHPHTREEDALVWGRMPSTAREKYYYLSRVRGHSGPAVQCVCGPELSPILRVALQPWSPALHQYVFSCHYRDMVTNIYLARHLTTAAVMPEELWCVVIGYIWRAWFWAETPPLQKAHRSSSHPSMVAWRATLRPTSGGMPRMCSFCARYSSCESAD